MDKAELKAGSPHKENSSEAENHSKKLKRKIGLKTNKQTFDWSRIFETETEPMVK